MIVLGIILIIVGILVPQLEVLEIIGIILLLVGAVLFVLGQTGRPIGGRRYWY